MGQSTMTSGQSDPSKLVIMTIGKTAVGKTTTLERVCASMGALHISEAGIKEALKSHYCAKDCLDEGLRDLAYRGAIAIAFHTASSGVAAAIDASFHRLHRRQWLYEAVSQTAIRLAVLHCYCENPRKITQRIAERQRAPLTAKTHAGSMDIVRHIASGFETPKVQELPSSVPTAFFQVNTDSNHLEDVKVESAGDGEFQSLADLLKSTLEQHLESCRGGIVPRMV